MLTTPLGTICITMDGHPVSCKIVPVQNPNLFPDVSGAYLLGIEYQPDGNAHELRCVLDASIQGSAESGERLEAISFYDHQRKLTIGCEGWFGAPEAYGYDYDGAYLPNGLAISISPQTKQKTFLFGAAWLDPYKSEQDVQTWLAADPTITGDNFIL